MRLRIFYVWLLPLLWAFFTVISFFRSGDEHGCFFIGALAGTWIGYFCRFDSMASALPAVLTTGVIIIGLAGGLMDLLSVGKRLWFMVFVLLWVGMVSVCARQYESFDHIANKHGSVLAPASLVLNLALYASIVLGITVAIFQRLWRLARRSKRPAADAPRPTWPNRAEDSSVQGCPQGTGASLKRGGTPQGLESRRPIKCGDKD